MLKRLNDLSFVIGIFFTIISIILFVNLLVQSQTGKLSVFTATGFLVFGLAMMAPSRKKR